MSSFEVTDSEFGGDARRYVGPLPDATISGKGDLRPDEQVAEPAVAASRSSEVAVEGLAQAARNRHDLPSTEKPSPDEREPGTTEQASSTSELEGRPKLYHVDRITKTDPDAASSASEFTDGNRAPLSRIAESGRRGQKQVMSMTKEESSLKVEVSESMVPIRAHVVPEKSATAETPPDRFKRWTLLDCKQASTDEVVETAVTQGSNGFDVRRLMAEHQGPFKVVIEADPLDAAEQKEIKETTSHQLDAAKNSEVEDYEVADLRYFQERLGEGKKTAFFRVGIAVGAETDEALGELVQQIKDNALQSSGRFKWSERTDAQGRMVTFDSVTQALDAKPDVDPRKAGTSEDSFLMAREFRTLAQFPPTPVPGVEVRAKAETFAVERKISEGVQSTRIGRVLDSDGKEVPGKRGEVRVTDKEAFGIFGASGTGKTTALHTDIVETIADACRRGESVGVLLADCEKAGNHDKLADALEAYRFPDGTGLPDEWKVVRRVRPGEDGLRAIIDPFKIAGNNSPSKQLYDGIRTLGSGILTQEEYHIFIKYGEIGMKNATLAVGTDPEDARPTDGGKYMQGSELAGQEVIMPTMDMITPYILEAIDQAKCEQKIKDNLRNYMETEVGKASTGVDQALYQNGNPLDGKAMVQAKGVTLFELGGLSESGKAIATSSLMRLSVESLRALKTGAGDVHRTRFKFIVDEATIYDKTKPAAAENAHYATFVRGEGAQLVVAKTTGVDVLHHELRGNLRNILAFHLTRPEDLDEVAGSMGNTRPEEVKSFLASAPQLEGIYYGPDMPTGPVRVRLDDPKRKPQADGSRHITDALDIVHRGIDPRVLDGYDKTAASRMLKTTPEGAVVTAWTQLDAIAVATNHPPVGLGDEWRGRVAGYGAQRDINTRDAAITQGVQWAVAVRPEIPNRMAVAKDQVVALLENANGTGTPVEEQLPRVDLAMPQFRYRPVRAEIEAAMNKTPTHPNIAPYEAVHGSIEGENAQQQLAYVEKLRKDSLATLGTIITETADQSVEAISRAAQETAKLVGRYNADQRPEVFIRQQVEKELGRRLTGPEVQNYNRAVAEARGLEGVLEAGYAGLRDELQQLIDARAQQDGINLGTWSTHYKEAFPSPQEGSDTRVTLRDQLAFIDNKQRQYNVKHRARDVDLIDVVFAPHPALGGIVWDRVIDNLRPVERARQSERTRQGRIFQQQQRLYNQGQLPTFEFTELLRTDPEGALEWSRVMKRLIHGDYFRMSPEMKQFISDVIDEAVTELTAVADEKNKNVANEQKDEN